MRAQNNLVIKVKRICKSCEAEFTANNNKSVLCLRCRNIERAVENTGFTEKHKDKTITLSNGLEILNNAAGKEVAYGG